MQENGKNGNPLFQPLPRDVVSLPQEKEAAFVAGLSRSTGQAGWRRAWIACDGDGEIMGHVDLRAHGDAVIAHRALLGMGVGLAWRRRGVARELLDFACQWAARSGLEWVDIEVLAANAPAVSLYRQAGFEQLCEIPDMYRIDGEPEAVIRMARKAAG